MSTPAPDRIPWGWASLPHPETGEPHCLPLSDTGCHAFDMECACCPVDDPLGGTIHHAFDGRERYETGAAKTH